MITGSVQPKAGKFYLVINLYENGKRKPEWIPTGLPVRGNKKAAKELLRCELEKYNSTDNKSEKALLQDKEKKNLMKSEGDRSVSDPQSQDVSGYSLIEFCRKWLQDKKPCIEENTFATYEYQVERIIDYFTECDLMLQQLQPVDVHEFYQYLAREGNQSNTAKGGKGLSARTIKDIAQRFRAILQMAQSLRLIEENPCKGIEVPKPLNKDALQDDEDLYMNEDELALFFRYTGKNEEPLHFLFMVTEYCGFRREEVGGLNWNRIDLEKREMTVLETKVRVKGKDCIKSRTKNIASYRVYPIGDWLLEILLYIKKVQEKNKELFGRAYQDNNGEVFTWPDGKPFRLDYITSRFKAIIRKIPELDERLHFHDLRKSCISNLALKGYSLKEVQKWVGQEDLETTVRIYNKVRQQDKERISSGLNAVFSDMIPVGEKR